MKRTENLNLPIYDNPESDIFKINDVNNAHETIDKQYKELKNIKETVESTNPSANLQGQINDINASLEHITKYKKAQTNLLSNVLQKLSKHEKIKIGCQGDSLTYGHDTTSAGMWDLFLNNSLTYSYSHIGCSASLYPHMDIK